MTSLFSLVPYYCVGTFQKNQFMRVLFSDWESTDRSKFNTCIRSPFDSSCQQHCLDLDECHFFTMYGVKDTPKDHMKCFMFKTCDHLEPCPECTTGKRMLNLISLINLIFKKILNFLFLNLWIFPIFEFCPKTQELLKKN